MPFIWLECLPNDTRALSLLYPADLKISPNMTLYPSDIAATTYAILVGFFGLQCNGFLLAVILSSKELRNKDYICIILSRGIVDFLHCVLLAVFQPFAILSESEPWCNVVAFADIATGSASMFFEPLLACNRYVSIFYSILHKKVYTIRNVIFMCVGVLILATSVTVAHIFTGDLGRATGFTCSVMMSRDSIVVSSITTYIPALLSSGAVAFFNYKIYRFLRQHQNQQMTNAQRTKLQSDREMLNFIMVAAFFPLVIQSPAIVAMWTNMFIPLSDWILFCALILLHSFHLVNPLLALFMVKPLKSRLMSLIRSLRGKNSVVPLAVGPCGPANGSK